MTREPGFYWLRAEDGTWTVGECESDGGWAIVGSDCPFREKDGTVYAANHGPLSREQLTIGPRIEAPGEEGTR